METLWTNEHLTISDIVKRGDAGEIALPRFQRPYVWRRPAQISFLAAVLQNLPSGALLLLEVDEANQGFAPTQLEGAPSLAKGSTPKELILDGQQRITTLYRAFNPSAGETVLVDVKTMLERDEFTDDLLEFSKTTPPLVEQAAMGKISLSEFVNSANRPVWCLEYIQQHLDGDQAQFPVLLERLNEMLPGAETDDHHHLPVIKIKAGASIAAIVNIFEGINRRGTRLNGFDLMVARLYQELPDGTFFDLRETWEAELAKHDGLLSMGFDADSDGLLPLQIIALAVSRLPDEVRPKGVRGVKQSDILELPPSQVTGVDDGSAPIKGLNLSKAFEALAAAVEFLKQHCGVAERQFIPQESMLIPLADQFLQVEEQRLSNSELKSWFFSTGLLKRYYGSVNSYVESDARQLRAWKSGGTKPDAIAQLTKGFVKEISFTQTAKRDGKILDRTVMAMLVAFGAKDWSKGQPLLNTLGAHLEIHHAVPAETLRKLVPKDEQDPIAIRTPITAKQNGSFRDKSPADIHDQLGNEAAPILESHAFGPELFAAFKANKQSLDAILRDREDRLRKFVISSLGL